MVFRFGPFEFDAAGYRLLRDSRALDLSPKLLDLLRHLLERPSTLVTKDELFAAVCSRGFSGRKGHGLRRTPIV